MADAKEEAYDMALLEKVQEFCMSTGFEKDFEDFGRRYWRVFSEVDAHGEQKLEWHEIYNEYLETFEGRIETFIRSEGAEPSEFQAQAKEAMKRLSLSDPRRFFVEALLSTTTYDMFLRLMVGEAQKYAFEAGEGKDAAEGKEDRKEAKK